MGFFETVIKKGQTEKERLREKLNDIKVRAIQLNRRITNNHLIFGFALAVLAMSLYYLYKVD